MMFGGSKNIGNEFKTFLKCFFKQVYLKKQQPQF